MRTSRRKQSFPTWQLSERYVNREYSWLQFNRRVLYEASRTDNPILERLKFLSIFESNLDEFYMVRVSGLIEQVEGGVTDPSPDGLTPEAQVKLVSQTSKALRQEADDIYQDAIVPTLREVGIELVKPRDLSERERAELAAYFLKEVFPVCTPLIIDPNPRTPFMSNRSLNVAVILSADGKERLARVKVPTVLPRSIKIPDTLKFVLLEDLIMEHLGLLFPGIEVRGSWMFRVIRDADIEIRELEAADLIASIEGLLKRRRFGDPVLLECDEEMPSDIRRTLLRVLELDEEDCMMVEGLIGLDALWEIADVPIPGLHFPPFKPYFPEKKLSGASLFEVVRRRDLLVHTPFDSFESVRQFVSAAATDPNVIGIKITLYRVGAESPIVESLLKAAELGKQVAATVELKARFDESNNVVWAKALERAGVHVSFGFPEMKVHCKLCQVVRREGDELITYSHIGTGNYNPFTSKIYTDLGLITADPGINQDVGELFNYLTGFSKQTDFRHLLIAPYTLREGIIARIEREVEVHRKHGNGRIIFKLNALVDPEVIESLYDASSAGVPIDLIVRGISCVRPDVKGLSENIRVTSIVGRLLEHSRAYYFGNNGDPEVFIGSSDLMRRNLDRRIEVLTPLLDPTLVKLVKSQLLDVYLKDNTNAWHENQEGLYARSKPKKNADQFCSQEELIRLPLTKLQFS